MFTPDTVLIAADYVRTYIKDQKHSRHTAIQTFNFKISWTLIPCDDDLSFSIYGLGEAAYVLLEFVHCIEELNLNLA